MSLRTDASYGLQSISRRAARRRLAAVFTAGVNQLLVVPVIIVRLPCAAAALSVSMSTTAEATQSTPLLVARQRSLESMCSLRTSDIARGSQFDL